MTREHEADNADRLAWREMQVIVFLYALFGVLWILLSDQAMLAMFDRPEDLVRVSMYKGWFFIAATTVLLYGLLAIFVQRLLTARRRERQLELEKRKSLELLDAVANSSDDAIFAKNLDGHYILFNRAASEFVGQPFEAVLGRDDRAIFPPDQAQRLMESGRQIMADGLVRTQEEVLTTAHGPRVFQATRGPLRDADGQVIGLFGISRDVTERKRAEDTIKQVSEDLAATLQAIPDLLFVVDADGRYLDIKATRENLLAAPETRLVGHTVREMLPPDAAETCMAALAGAEREGADYGRVITLGLPDGERQFELSVARKAVQPGAPAQFVALSRDITERKATEQALRRSEAQFRALVEQSLAGIYIIQDGRFRYVNPGFAAMFGYDLPEQIVEKISPGELVSPRDRAKVEENIRQRLNGEVEAIHYEFTGLRRDGRSVEVEVYGRSFEYEGRPAIIGFILDLTASKTGALELKRRNEELERFNRASVGREMEMIELKRQINALVRELGRAPPYSLAFLNDEADRDQP